MSLMQTTVKNESKTIKTVLLLLALGLASYLVIHTTTIYMGVATLAYLLMVCGLMKRKEPEVHRVFMGAAMFIDVSLVLILELQRSAVNTAVTEAMNGMQYTHIVASTAAVVLYFPLIYLGISNYRNKNSKLSRRKAHKRLGITAFIFRTIGFLTMFSLIGRVM